MSSASGRRHAAVTICALNYFGRALVLRDSYLKTHPDSDFYVVLVSRKDPAVEARNPDTSVIWAEDLGVPGFLHAAMKFDVVELCTNVKPAVLKKLLPMYEAVLYIDPDVRVYSRLIPVFDALANHSIVVTPHALTPILDGESPSDEDFSRFGSFNLGFLGVSRCSEAFAFLDWWSERCLKLGFYEPQSGLAVDQKWMDLAPCYFTGLKIMRDLGLNVAFWNLHERRLSEQAGKWLVNGASPLYFFHFSSFPAQEPHAIARNQSRFPVGSRPEMYPLLDDYASLLEKAGQSDFARLPYSFDYFADGAYVTQTLRRLYSVHEAAFQEEADPFAEGSAVHRFAMKRRLAIKNHRPGERVTSRNLGRFSSVTRLLEGGLALTLRLVGPERYFVLMKYLAYISSIRHQERLVPPPEHRRPVRETR